MVPSLLCVDGLWEALSILQGTELVLPAGLSRHCSARALLPANSSGSQLESGSREQPVEHPNSSKMKISGKLNCKKRGALEKSGTYSRSSTFSVGEARCGRL